MDLAQERLHLQEVERHIAITEFRLVRQRRLVEGDREHGRPDADEVRMLTAMEGALEAMCHLRCAIRTTVARLEKEP